MKTPLARAFLAERTRVTSRKVAVTFHDPKHATPELVDERFEAVNDRNKVLRILSIAKSAIRHNMAKDLPSMDVPVCLIWGKNDIITLPEVAEEFLDGFPDADLHWIDECGHAPMMEHPETFNTILSDWYASRGIARPHGQLERTGMGFEGGVVCQKQRTALGMPRQIGLNSIHWLIERGQTPC